MRNSIFKVENSTHTHTRKLRFVQGEFSLYSRNVIVVISASLLCFFLCSCDPMKKDVQSFQNTKIDLLMNSPERIGILHNEGLEFLFNYIKEKNESVSEIDKDKTVREGIRQFLLQSFSFSVDEISKVNTIINNIEISRVSVVNARKTFSPQLQEYLNRLDEITVEDRSDLVRLDSSIVHLEELAKKKLNGRELFIFRASASVGRYSSEYWGNNNEYNYYKWKAINEKTYPVYASILNIFSFANRRSEVTIAVPVGGWKRTLAVAAADVGGLSTGAYFGSGGGPWGTLIGGIVGCLAFSGVAMLDSQETLTPTMNDFSKPQTLAPTERSFIE